MTDLGDFLIAAGQRRRVPNKWDCCAMPAQWAIENGHPDPMAHWRGAYSTEEEAERFIRDSGGLLALFDCGMTSAAVARRQGEPQPGDIGVLSVAGHEAGAIFTGRRWAFVAERGIGFASVDPAAILAAWEVTLG